MGKSQISQNNKKKSPTMPPKKKGAKGKDSKPKSDTNPSTDSAERQKSEKEILLQNQLDSLDSQNAELRQKLDALRKQNRSLEDNANQSISETADYALYMKREAERRSNQIISVNEMNKHEIEIIGEECAELEKRFDQRLEELNKDLDEKKEKLRQANEELSALDKIKELETSLEAIRTKHSSEIQQMKADFLNEKKNLSNEADKEMSQLSTKATEVAASCLNQHAERIQVENQKLRSELLALLSESDGLQERKVELEQQYLAYVRENEYLDDLQKMRIH